MLRAKDITHAHKVLKDVVVNTPLDYDHYLSEKYQAKIYLKKENMQRVRSFKLRGAYYAISQLNEEERQRGVVCASAGNHAQGVAYTCKEMKIPATIFMPITTPQQKIGQVRFFGGEFVDIKLVGDTFDASAKAALDYTKAENRTFIDPFDNEDVQAGQGTVAYEILDEAKREAIDFDAVLVPVGGGGLISGVSTYIKESQPTIEVIGVEANGARSMKAAFEAGGPVKLKEIDKFADGIAVQKVGASTYEVTQKNVQNLIGVDEGLISETIIDLYSKQGIVAEPAGAASVAALEVLSEYIKGKTICKIIQRIQVLVGQKDRHNLLFCQLNIGTLQFFDGVSQTIHNGLPLLSDTNPMQAVFLSFCRGSCHNLNLIRFSQFLSSHALTLRRIDFVHRLFNFSIRLNLGNQSFDNDIAIGRHFFCNLLLDF